MKKLIILLAVTILIFSGCTKSDSSKPAQDFLTSHNWRSDAVYQDNVNMNIDACYRDDLWKFQTGNVFVFDQGAVKCVATDPQTNTGSWSISGQSLTISANGGSSTYTITVVDDSKLEMTRTNGSVYRYVFVAQ